MTEQVHEKISVLSVYDATNGMVMPRKLKWHGREYLITKLGYHHRVREGRTLLHIFDVSTDSAAFRLRFDTETLHWTLEEVYDESAA